MDRRESGTVLAARVRDLTDSRDIRAVVLAGGRGTRLAPYTTVLPKPLMPVGDMPILEILIRQLRRAGIGRITLAVGHLAALLEAYFGDGARLDVSLDYSYEDEPAGTAGPLALVDGLDTTFLVMNGDLLTTIDFDGPPPRASRGRSGGHGRPVREAGAHRPRHRRHRCQRTSHQLHREADAHLRRQRRYLRDGAVRARATSNVESGSTSPTSCSA